MAGDLAVARAVVCDVTDTTSNVVGAVGLDATKTSPEFPAPADNIASGLGLGQDDDART